MIHAVRPSAAADTGTPSPRRGKDVLVIDTEIRHPQHNIAFIELLAFEIDEIRKNLALALFNQKVLEGIEIQFTTPERNKLFFAGNVRCSPLYRIYVPCRQDANTDCSLFHEQSITIWHGTG